MNTFNADKVFSHFQFEGELVSITPTGNGHINDTFLVTTNAPKNYILQRINHHIFKSPETLMENIEAVCAHLQQKVLAEGGDIEREVLTLIPTHAHTSYFLDNEGYYWRAYVFITDAISYDIVPNNTVFYNAAYKFGEFQRFLLDFDASKLYETIPYFHHTKNRFNNFLHALENDCVRRAKTIPAEIDFVLSHEQDASSLIELYESGKLPLRVTHNDTKINNIMIDAYTQKGICVIDLDTVMPGLVAYDFGDCIRTGATSGAEDEVDLSKVHFMLDRFEAFTEGFLSSVGAHLTNDEIASLLIGAKIITFECGIRFLTDYLEGDTYFKIHRPNHNLDRARTQFKLVQDMEHHWQELETIIQKFMK
ncbi:aminoglycoside phosphotransferase family protein [Niameybacter massiliensis]|uniref:Aminoglycoside phosphotransferase family protein n=1 Tax=Holtiella tumoricola TaxID=3018743 RepID=A0AA42DQ59_9FIRM|nr:aminoglycoside phosphotransferase family protein [Holtiella tumoricola]MDA3733274.1 aminoglycoside phosphotransferase family protein [Holtiella tumoricola]